MSYRPIATFSYTRKLKAVTPGRVRQFRLNGKKVKAVSPDGHKLQIIDAPASLVPKIRTIHAKGDKLSPYKDQLRIIRSKKRKRDGARTKKPKPKSPRMKTPKPKKTVQTTMPVQAEEKPEEKEREAVDLKEEEEKVEPEIIVLKPTETLHPEVEPTTGPRTGKPRKLSVEERDRAQLVPVPDEGPVPTPYIDWEKIPEHCKIKSIIHYDYPVPGAPNGMLKALRDMYRRNRRYQDEAPVNVVIQGPKGTGKSQLIKAFCADTGLPYWQVIGQEGIRADELLGKYELVEGTSRWVDGIIPRAVRAGGVLHVDEPNVILPAILMRLDELLDNKRQLNMEDLNGELIKAHPDLFVVFTMNPPTYEGIEPLPDPIVSRLGKRFVLNYPPVKTEYKIVEAKLGAMGVRPSEFKIDRTGIPQGRYARDVVDFMKIIDGLRRDTSLSYTPSMRETIGFVQDLREGDNFHTSFDRNVKSWYWGEEADKIEEALTAVRRR